MHLLRIEWLKIKSYKTFWILLSTFFVFFPLTFYFFANKFMEAVNKDGEGKMLKNMMGNPFTFPKIWQAASWFGGLFFILLGMLFILLITNEVQYRTHRQNIIDGWSRLDFLKAKFFMMVIMILLSTVMVTVSGFIVGEIYSPASASITEGFYNIGYFALMATMYMMVAFLTAILVKRTGLAIIIYFAFVCIVDNLGWLILTYNDGQFGYYLPLESTDSLLPNPFKPGMLERRKVSDMSLIIAAMVYIVGFGALMVAHFRKTDIKT